MNYLKAKTVLYTIWAKMAAGSLLRCTIGVERFVAVYFGQSRLKYG